MSVDERRSQPRHPVRLVAEIDSETTEDSVLGVISDISVSGGRFLTSARFEPEDELQLTLHLSPDDPDRTVSVGCRVVRNTPLDASRAGIWQNEIAVRFERKLEDLADEIDELAQRLAASSESG